MGPQVTVDLCTGLLSGSTLHETVRTLADMNGYYGDRRACQNLDPQMLVYRVQTYQPVRKGEEGGLFFGTTSVQPGMAGDEYFMTKGHFHAKRNRAECYITLVGTGALILMDEDRRTAFEPMRPGSVSYVRGNTAHRVANVGDSVLTFLACWPSDAGHDYETIASKGFSARLRKINGIPTLVEEP